MEDGHQVMTKAHMTFKASLYKQRLHVKKKFLSF
jgi:hypothetical protein